MEVQHSKRAVGAEERGTNRFQRRVASSGSYAVVIS
jgi:hypothetical protein